MTAQGRVPHLGLAKTDADGAVALLQLFASVFFSLWACPTSRLAVDLVKFALRQFS